MNILVCIKPDMAEEEMGPFEALALEAALILKDELDDVRVDVVTVGPASWENVIRRAMGMGADNGFHLLFGEGSEDEALGLKGLMPASVTAGRLARAIVHPELMPRYDFILTGVMSQDLMAGQTGPMMAEYLGIPMATAVVRICQEGGRFTAVREREGGILETFELPLPCAVSVQPGRYVPRYPNLSNMLKAKSKPVMALTPEQIASEALEHHAVAITDTGHREMFLDVTVPEKSRAGLKAEGSLDDQIRAFQSFLKERALI